jgi:hypothetical protein
MGVETTPINFLHEKERVSARSVQIVAGKLFLHLAQWRTVCGVRAMQKVGSCLQATISMPGSCAD